jgi:hypothetical protein
MNKPSFLSNDAMTKLMKKVGFGLPVAFLVILFTATTAMAIAANYNSSRSNRKKTAGIVAPNVPCGGPGECLDGEPFGAVCFSNADCGIFDCALSVPNFTTAGGASACNPAVTFDELTPGNPSNGWVLGPKWKSKFGIKIKKGDAGLKIKLSDIRDRNGAPVTASGQVVLRLRRRSFSVDSFFDITYVPVTVAFDITVIDGKASFQGSLSQALEAAGQVGTGSQPSDFEILGLRLIDENGTRVGTDGFGVPLP